MAFQRDGETLPTIERGRVGICMPGRDGYGIFLWQSHLERSKPMPKGSQAGSAGSTVDAGLFPAK